MGDFMARQPDKHSSRSAADGLKAAEGALKEAGLQADTFVRSAANTATFGLADNAEAAGDATFGGGGSGDWAHRYQSELNQQKQRDVYDSVNRGVAKRLGEIGGVGLALGDVGVLGAESSAALPIRAKGVLGEGLSAAKTVLKGDWPVGFQVRHALQNGLKTVVDHDTAKGISVEAKFGPWARLTKNQRMAQAQWGDLYRVDRWGPRHVGGIAAGAAAPVAAFGAYQNEKHR
jgi:hypothetical protein